MLTEIRIQNKDRTELPVLTIPIFTPTKYAVQFVDGLTPVKAEISSSNYAGADGVFYQGRRVGARNVVLTLDLLPTYSANEDAAMLRAELYRYLTPGTPLAMTFVNHAGAQRLIDGIVESAEAPLFVQKPAMQASILCMDPYFRAAADTVVAGTYANGATIAVQNNGDVEVGLSASMKVLASGVELSLQTRSSDRLAITKALVANDTVLLNTNHGLRAVGLSTGGSLLSFVERGSSWPMLRPGPNSVIVSRGASATGNNTVSITYRERFVGL